MDLTPEQIKALGEAVSPIFAGVFTFLTAVVSAVLAWRQTQCRRELMKAKLEIDIAHAMRRAEKSGKTWQEEMRGVSDEWHQNHNGGGK